MIDSTTSSPGRSPGTQDWICIALAIRLRWVSIAAFGNPVVPPVYWKVATSSGLTFTCGARSDAPRSRRRKRKTPCVGLSGISGDIFRVSAGRAGVGTRAGIHPAWRR